MGAGVGVGWVRMWVQTWVRAWVRPSREVWVRVGARAGCNGRCVCGGGGSNDSRTHKVTTVAQGPHSHGGRAGAGCECPRVHRFCSIPLASQAQVVPCSHARQISA